MIVISHRFISFELSFQHFSNHSKMEHSETLWQPEKKKKMFYSFYEQDPFENIMFLHTYILELNQTLIE